MEETNINPVIKIEQNGKETILTNVDRTKEEILNAIETGKELVVHGLTLEGFKTGFTINKKEE